MNYLTVIILVFSVLGALDRIVGNRFGLGKEFEKAFMLLGTMALSIIGMIVISPFIAELMKPLSEFLVSSLHIDPSIIPASLFANDMGGATLAVEMAMDDKLGLYNALVVSSMMGCTMSFTIPFALGVVDKSQHEELLFGLLCGIATIPLGCIVSGVLCKIPFVSLLLVLMPLVIFSAIVACGLIYFPGFCVKAFKVFGSFITILITIGLALGIIRFLTGYEVIKGLATIEEGASISVNAAIVLSGSFPLMYVLSKVLSKPLKVVAKKMGVNEYSIVGIISCLASSTTSFGMMDKMDKKGTVLNSAFAVSGAFVVGTHLAFTMAFNSEYVIPVIFGKTVSGILAILLANAIYSKTNKVDSN
ncbi:MAG: ethanolamine utilization protein EutH [Ruminococcaceae bacterium]|nr:ethanolamine utilization protein EutH [Oscillospiraceae bacterium]